MTRRVPPFDLMVITDPSIDGWYEAIERIIEDAPPDRVAIQVRAENRGSAELLAIARRLRPRTSARRVALLINDRIDVALRASADGVHLKESGLEVADARALLGDDAWIGASCHDRAGLARRAGADYVTLGPYRGVPGKAPALGAAGFTELAARSAAPVFALGGIDASAIEAVIAAGARGVALVRAIQTASEPSRVMHAILESLDRARLVHR